MNVSRERRGSALLIVLGFVAFLIVSAVTFSIYMRQSRLPSSYLRRTATSRQLVKAALARAIDFTESCIKNDPHPNVRTAAESFNYWYGRVLTGVNALVSVSNTVPTLTLEGLAYIPPPLVNAVRYYSRLTPTAMWQRFGYDTGRYAFAVVDVSDYFDVNRMFADKGRSSAANRRVSLAYLFEDGADHSSPPSKAGDWDDFMDDFRKVEEGSLAVSYDGKYPLISVCDLNLAMGKEDVAGFKSYFCDYIGAQGNRAGFYNTKNEDDEDRVERMTFVTDSIPSGRKSTSLAAGTETPVADLADADNQPFKMADLEKENASAYKVMLGELCQTKNTKPHDASGNPVTEPSGGDFLWQNHISGLGLAALWDYLDTDSYPISLAVPTTERHAMICGIEPMLKNDPGLSVVRTVSHEPGSPLPNAQPGDKSVQMKTTVKYTLTLKNLVDQASLVKVATVYPFSHADELTKEDMKFSVDGLFKFFFSNQKMTLRTGTGDKLHPDASGFANPTEIKPELGQISINLSQGGVPVAFDAAEVKEEKDAVKLVSGSGGTSVLSIGNATALETEFKNKVFLELEYNWVKPGNAGDTDQYFKGNIANNPGAVNKLGQPNLTSAHTDWRPLDAEGKPVDDGFDDDSLLSKLKGGYSASPATLYFNAAVWLRVKSSGDGERVVDMVPACFEDDKQSGGSSGGGASAQLMSEIGKEICGRTYPLFRFDTEGGKGNSIEFSFSVEELDKMSETPKTVTLYPGAAIVADPRWNFAPEYWYSLGGTLSEDAWLKNCHRDQGDGDIFMATSDQGYLQSIYELAFLPRFKSLVASNGGAQLIGSLTSLERASADGIAQNFGGIPNSGYMWRMFDPMDDDEDAFDKLPFASIGRGMRVNPYSDSTNVIMAAFANTPASWRVASTNNEEELESLSAADYNKKYAYCAYADDESRKVKWADMKELAGRFMDRIRASSSGAAAYDWSKVWDDLDWFGDEKELWGVSFSSQNTRFWGADKRFLYGYWRDCFAAEQQLFLVFVRAEPLMMGGGEIGQTPPQLGARAVALVWRDPKAPADASAPHKTRVLFYRQFE